MESEAVIGSDSGWRTSVEHIFGQGSGRIIPRITPGFHLQSYALPPPPLCPLPPPPRHCPRPPEPSAHPIGNIDRGFKRLSVQFPNLRIDFGLRSNTSGNKYRYFRPCKYYEQPVERDSASTIRERVWLKSLIMKYRSIREAEGEGSLQIFSS